MCKGIMCDTAVIDEVKRLQEENERLQASIDLHKTLYERAMVDVEFYKKRVENQYEENNLLRERVEKNENEEN